MPLNGNTYSSTEQQPTACRGVRGAVTVKENTEDAILAATRELLQVIIQRNEMRPEDVASVYFTTTMDLNATYPALAARQIGWSDVALLCGHEMAVPGGLERCIRVLIHWNTTHSAQEIVHVYLREAQSLRPDRQNLPPIRPRQMNAMEAMVKVMASVL
ncbi:MAG: chorismate mutase [Anaerolineaceae bacterium]|nr:chorismate mutase [Anaerolineaceae bacterium]